jgi:hypothetical protein
MVCGIRGFNRAVGRRADSNMCAMPSPRAMRRFAAEGVDRRSETAVLNGRFSEKRTTESSTPIEIATRYDGAV